MKPKKTRAVNSHAERTPCVGEERIRPDGSLIRYVREEGEDGYTVEHYRTVDTLGLMLRNGSITPAMYDAGQHFAQDFARAFSSGVASPKLDGLPAGTARVELMVERNAGAARAVRQVLDAVGGISSPAGTALWFVAGAGLSIIDLARRMSCNRHEAKGYLVAALAIAAKFYGYGR